jgi:alcohol dehydrogenase class IV
MKNVYHISNTPELYMGCGSVQNLSALATRFQGPVLIISGGSTLKNIPFLQSFIEEFKSKSRFAGCVKITREPSPDDVDEAVGIYRSADIGCIIAMGGGSVMDAGKAISAMLMAKGSVKDYLEGVGTKAPDGRKVPFIAVPTTAGTGSEATQNAVISRQGPEGFKKSLRHMNYVPDVAVVDPELTVSCPPQTTAASGMDAFTQLMESYVSTRANPFTDALALDAMGRVYRSLEDAFRSGHNLEARSELAYAAYVSGITLANAGLGVIHGFAQPLGSLYGIPHGVVCGTLMGAANRITVEKLKEKGPSNRGTTRKYVEIGKLFAGTGGKSDAYYSDFCITEIERLTHELQLPLLSRYGVKEAHFGDIIAQTSLKYHPVQLDENDLGTILARRL